MNRSQIKGPPELALIDFNVHNGVCAQLPELGLRHFSSTFKVAISASILLLNYFADDSTSSYFHQIKMENNSIFSEISPLEAFFRISFKKYISSSSELLCNNSLFEGQL